VALTEMSNVIINVNVNTLLFKCGLLCNGVVLSPIPDLSKLRLGWTHGSNTFEKSFISEI